MTRLQELLKDEGVELGKLLEMLEEGVKIPVETIDDLQKLEKIFNLLGYEMEYDQGYDNVRGVAL